MDFDAEEVDFGGAGQAGTPQAYQKDVAELKRSLDLLTKNKVESLSTSDIQGMIAMGQESAVKDLDGKLAMMKSSTMESLEQINGAYAELVKLELDRAKIFREAVSNLKQAILNTKISDSQREEMFAKVESMKSELDGAAKAEVTKMLADMMELTHKNALEGAAGKVEEMAQVIENNVKESALAREETAKNVGALMAAAAGAAGEDAGKAGMKERERDDSAAGAGLAGADAGKAGKKRGNDDSAGGAIGSVHRPKKQSGAGGSPGRKRDTERAGREVAMEETRTELMVRTSPDH